MVLALTTGGAPRWAHAPSPGDDPAVAARPTGHADLPDAEGTCRSLAAAVIEVLAGFRPAAQLTRWTTADVHTQLTRSATLTARLHSTGTHPRTQRPAAVRHLRITRPADGVIEAAAVVRDAHRIRAVALRLEGWDTRWRLTALEIG